MTSCIAGWDVDQGCVDGLQPEVLISIVAPKQCSRHFQGKHHFLGGRFVPPDLAKKYQLSIPPYSGSSSVLEIPTASRNTACSNSSSEDRLVQKSSPEKTAAADTRRDQLGTNDVIG